MVTKVQQDKAEQEKNKKIKFELVLFNSLIRYINLIVREAKSNYNLTEQVLSVNQFSDNMKNILGRSYSTIQASILKTEIRDFERGVRENVIDEDLEKLTSILNADNVNKIQSNSAIILKTMQTKLNEFMFKIGKDDVTLNSALRDFKNQQKTHAKFITSNTQVQASYETIKSDINGYLIVRYANEFVSKKVWVTVGDDRVRLWHREANGQSVIYNSKFTVGPDQLLYPGDPSGQPANIINCRCSAIHSFSRA